jgi:Helix-turn-helix domain
MVAVARIQRIISSALYSSEELASYLGIQPRTLETWRRLGRHPELRYRRVGRRIRYLGQDVLNFLNSDTT